MSVKMNGRHLAKFVADDEFDAIFPQVSLAHETLHGKTGPGSDFLGWVCLLYTSSAGILESTVNTETEEDRFMSENTKNPAVEKFLPVCKADMLARGWRDVDFVLSLIHIYCLHQLLFV